MKTLFIDGKRTGYSPEQCGETLTAKQLANALLNAIEWGDIDADSPVYLANDSGYTYGEINEWNSISVGEDYEHAERMNIQTERDED